MRDAHTLDAAALAAWLTQHDGPCALSTARGYLAAWAHSTAAGDPRVTRGAASPRGGRRPYLVAVADVRRWVDALATLRTMGATREAA